jgi:hypothetical protein
VAQLRLKTSLKSADGILRIYPFYARWEGEQ